MFRRTYMKRDSGLSSGRSGSSCTLRNMDAVFDSLLASSSAFNHLQASPDLEFNKSSDSSSELIDESCQVQNESLHPNIETKVFKKTKPTVKTKQKVPLRVKYDANHAKERVLNNSSSSESSSSNSSLDSLDFVINTFVLENFTDKGFPDTSIFASTPLRIRNSLRRNKDYSNKENQPQTNVLPKSNIKHSEEIHEDNYCDNSYVNINSTKTEDILLINDTSNMTISESNDSFKNETIITIDSSECPEEELSIYNSQFITSRNRFNNYSDMLDSIQEISDTSMLECSYDAEKTTIESNNRCSSEQDCEDISEIDKQNIADVSMLECSYDAETTTIESNNQFTTERDYENISETNEQDIADMSLLECSYNAEKTIEDNSETDNGVITDTIQEITDTSSSEYSDAETSKSADSLPRRSKRLLTKEQLRFPDVKKTTAFVPKFFRSADRPSIIIAPGKGWGRRLSIVRQATLFNMTHENLNSTFYDGNGRRGRRYQSSVDQVMGIQANKDYSMVFNSTLLHHRSIMQGERTVLNDTADSSDKTIVNEITCLNCDDTKVDVSRLSISERDDTAERKDFSARDRVLRCCAQLHPLPFDECYPEARLGNCQKIGEGVFGEVYLRRNESDPLRPTVMKVIPIEGKQLVNDQKQKTFDEVLSEIVIATELSGLRTNHYNHTPSFNEVKGIKCVRGRYPDRLLELWELYDETRGSENDCPSIFKADQLYIVLELENGGKDLESFNFNDASQSYAVFVQIVHALAVAEEACEFEHRDLHWGNVLINHTYEPTTPCTLRGVDYDVPTNGVLATVIDFTLARMSLNHEGNVLFSDLATDEELFEADGDYQYEIYRLMRDKIENNWRNFEPYTNILWMHYLLSKMILGFRYEKIMTKRHGIYLSKLKKAYNNILNYNSCTDFVLGGEF